ncbi:glycerol-3-phosphate 1-O-acyltransferase PlsY [Ketobacter alkanivorans]|uniref:Glycerol-3-phosphate acyltransferase n=1 Tax=Ketobacter alkanivorans TaxID=1917421 RepID=A0A2K9LNR9_9GAMM|nr:glycerol-3-phosphate 1-O-acyltransferase PlsY [Ketobacter alkanivorans]AUM13988.1 acyl-phosphate glycerol 3-phosphate acyltransferase [Ketobacter alkanivorans]MCP5017865.1 glycerol-3-phosphate 1-O-acyltransferase PlsY [Ketobacter sp.]
MSFSFTGDKILESLLAIVLWIFSYLLGSISAAILVCRIFGFPDPRSTGSHNPGATNVLRVGNKFAAALTLIGDVAKGVAPIIIARELGLPESIAALCGFCAFLGHLYPVYFDFRGGKGVATAFGVLATLHWPSMLVIGGLWLLVFASTRISSLASITSFFLAPLIVLLFKAELFHPILVLSLMLLFRHRHNITQLVKGEEQSFRKTSQRD